MSVVTGLTLALSLSVASASAESAKPVVKVAPGVYLGKVSAEAKGNVAPRSKSEPGSGLDAKSDAKSPKIVGGTPTTISQWPWQTALITDETLAPGDDFDRQFCGGSLVAPNIVVSAAHCVFDVTPVLGDDGDNDFDDVFFDAVTGRTVLSSTAGQEIGVDDYFFFVNGVGDPLFTGNPEDGWDLIFIQLSSNSISQRIKVAGPTEGAVWTPGRTSFATGWGALQEGPPQTFPDQLRQVQLGILSNDTCSGTYGADFDPQLMLCAGVLSGGKDTCQGDSGGPLVVPIAGGGFRLVGDTSFGDGCGRVNVPGIYGRIADDPMRTALANGVLDVAGVNILGSGAQPPPGPQTGPSQACLDAQSLLENRQHKLKKAKKKLKKAKKTGKKPKVKKAKKKVKKAKKKVKRAKQAVEDAC